MNFDIEKNLGLSLRVKKKAEKTQDCVPEVGIVNGVIVSLDERNKKHFTKVLEVIALNYAIKSPEEQNRVILKYAASLKTGPSNFKIKITTRESNVEEYIEMAKAAYEKEMSTSCRELIQNYIGYLVNGQANLETLKKHYYFIFEYEPDPFGQAASTEEEAIEQVNIMAENVKREFAAIGNEVITTSPSLEDFTIAEMLYNHYNQRTCNRDPFESRVQRITNDIKIVNGLSSYDEDPELELKDIIAPKSIDFSANPDYAIIDGLYRSHYYIAGDSIPTYMSTEYGWLTALSNYGYGYELDIFFFKGDSTEKLLSVRNNLKFSKYKLATTEDEQENAEDVLENYSGSMYIKQALKSGGESIYEMAVLITAISYTKEEYQKRHKFLLNEAVKLDLVIRPCKRLQEEGLMSTGYTLLLSPKIYSLAHRNLTTSAVAASYPFTAFTLSDSKGIALGYHRGNDSLVCYDMFDPKYTNANLALYGASGHGKTYALMTITSRLRYLGVQNFIIAPIKQHEFKRLCDALGGEFIDVASTSQQRINIFDIRPLSSPEAKFLGDEGYVNKSWLVDKIDNLKVWMTYLIPEMTRAEKTRIETILVSMYADFGITEDNDSIYADESHTKLKKPPILSDFYERVCNDNFLTDDVKVILSQFINGAAQNMNGYTNVDLNNQFTVFGLENIKGELLAPTMFIILEFIWAKCRENRTKRKVVAIDEGWKLLNGQNRQVGEFVQDIFKLIRGYGGSAIFATQSITDLFAGNDNFGNAILSCSHSKVILGMEKTELDNISSTLGLSAEEQDTIIGSGAGEALLCAGPNHIPIKFAVSPREHELFTTRSDELARIAKREAERQNGS